MHGGPEGFDAQVWDARALPDAAGTGVELHFTSPAGDQGFPGTLHATVRYLLDDAGTLRLEYEATADAPTPVNLTNHAYFHLAPEEAGTVLGHRLYLAADHYTPVDAHLIPLPGPPHPVAGTPFDFTTPRLIGDRIGGEDQQLRLAGGGYDHNWVLRQREEPLAVAAVLEHEQSGRRLECATTEPGIQVYTANNFAGGVRGRTAAACPSMPAVALETQHFPDSPGRPDYPRVWLSPGETYRSVTTYRVTAAGPQDRTRA